MMYLKWVELAAKYIPWKRIFQKRQRCLLIIEDNEPDAEFLKALIGVMGHDALIVNNAETGFTLISQKPERFPICFVDLRLPLMPGLVFIKKVIAAAPSVHVIVVAGELSDLGELIRGCYIGVIGKPVTASAIRSVVAKTSM